METAQLIQWIRKPESLNNESLVLLKDALEAYPCFTTLRMLYQKNLLELQDVRFSSELVRTAISSPDRSKLFLFMEGRTQDCLTGEKADQSTTHDDFSLIDRFLRQATDHTKKAPTPILENDEVVDEFGLAGFSLDDMAVADQERVSSNPLQGHEWIDAFLDNEHAVTSEMVSDGKNPVADDLSENEAVEALIDTLPEDSFSEALAKIYLKQKRYDKALEIIKSLRLKYPEKNSYFADQIRFLEKLIILQKK